MKPQVVAFELNKLLTDATIITTDSGTNTSWAARYLDIRGDMMFSASGMLATMALLPFSRSLALPVFVAAFGGHVEHGVRADERVQAAAAATQAAVGFTFRRSPAIAGIAERIRSGAIGAPVHFNGHYWCDYAADPRGPMSWRYRGGPGSGAAGG